MLTPQEQTYLGFLFAGLFGAVFPWVLRILSSRLKRNPTSPSGPQPKRAQLKAFADPGSVGRRLNTRYFVAMNLSLVLSLFLVLMVMGVAAFRLKVAVFYVLGLVLLFSLLVIYHARKGELSWMHESKSDSTAVDGTTLQGSKGGDSL